MVKTSVRVHTDKGVKPVWLADSRGGKQFKKLDRVKHRPLTLKQIRYLWRAIDKAAATAPEGKPSK